MFVVAGVTGHVGSVVATELLAKGKKVKVLVRDAAKGAAWSKKGAEVAVVSLSDAAALGAALKGAAGFFTLLPADFGAADFYAAQRALAGSIAAAVKQSALPHVVILSSVGADLSQGTGPIQGLFHLETALRATGTKLTAIRAGYFQENIANSITAAKTAGIFPNFMPSADSLMPMVATKDIGMLAAQALLQPPKTNEVVDIQGPAYSIRQLAKKLGTALGQTVEIVDIPAAGHVDAMVQAGLPKQVAEAYAEMYRGFASAAIQPRGDRMVQGKTEIDEIIKGLLS